VKVLVEKLQVKSKSKKNKALAKELAPEQAQVPNNKFSSRCGEKAYFHRFEDCIVMAERVVKCSDFINDSFCFSRFLPLGIRSFFFFFFHSMCAPILNL
jgi:ribosomal protein L32